MEPRTYVCTNPECQHYQVERELHPGRVTGSGLYTWPAVVCECNLDIELQRVETGYEVVGGKVTTPRMGQLPEHWEVVDGHGSLEITDEKDIVDAELVDEPSEPCS